MRADLDGEKDERLAALAAGGGRGAVAGPGGPPPRRGARALSAAGGGGARAPGPGEAAGGNEERRRVSDAMAGLPAELRMVMVLRAVEGLSYGEIALAAGVPAGAG